MLVKFHVLQEDTDTGKTHEQPIYDQEWGLIMVGQQVNYAGTILRVNSLEWIDMKAGVLKAVCLEVPAMKE